MVIALVSVCASSNGITVTNSAIFLDFGGRVVTTVLAAPNLLRNVEELSLNLRNSELFAHGDVLS